MMYYNKPVDEMDASNYLDSEGRLYASVLETQTDLNNQLCEANWAKTTRIDIEIQTTEFLGV